MYKIPLSYTPIDERKLSAILRRYENRPHTALVQDFEETIAGITGARYVVAMNSGTASLHLALRALEVGKDDDVLAPTFTYVASVNPVLYQGAVPVLIDSERNTWNIDPVLLEEAILAREKKAKAIVVVHGYGMPANMGEIIRISEKYNIPVVEDAAEALGSYYKGKHLGTLTSVGVLSFNNNKIVTTYGGGALMTNDEALYRRVLHWASQSRENKSYYEHCEVGFNYRMSALNAAYGLASLDGLNELVEHKKSVLDLYKQELSAEPAIAFQQAPAGYDANHWLTTILITSARDHTDISQIQQSLAAQGIESRPLWRPMHLQPLYQDADFYGAGVSDRLFQTGLCLPSGKELGRNEIRGISRIILEAIERLR